MIHNRGKMNPAMRRAQRHQKNTKKQAEELAAKKHHAKPSTESVVSPRRSRVKNPAALVNKANQPKVVAKPPPKTSSKAVNDEKKRRLAERQKQRKERDRSRSASRSRSVAESHDSEDHSEVVAKVKPKSNSKNKKAPEQFPEYHYVKATKTAKQLMDEKKKNAAARNQLSPEEYEKIKEARLKADTDAVKTKKVVKADTEIKKKVVRDKETGKKKYKYVRQDPKTFDEYWEDAEYKPEKMDKIKDLTDADASRQVDNVMKRTGKKYGPNEILKIGDDVKEVFTLEDLDPKNDELENSIPIVDVDSIDTMFNATILKNSRRDVLLIGLSESTKDAIIDEIMGSKLGKSDKVFDATGISDDEEKPKGCVCIYSDTVPIKPQADHDSTVEEESSEDSFDAQHKDRIRKVREKQANDKSKKKEPRHIKKKVVKAVEDKKYEEAPYDLRKDYPSARFIFLTKASAIDRVDLQKLWKNTASFIEFKRFKKKFSELNRYECLVVDQLNKKRLYRIEFE